jgi:hypothetical protein
MPRATNRYPFEWRVFSWAGQFSYKMTGESHVPMLILLSPQGNAKEVHFGDQPEEPIKPEWTALHEAADSWFLYDPFDGPVYTALWWTEISRETMERLMGEPFPEEELRPPEDGEPFPCSWHVVF